MEWIKDEDSFKVPVKSRCKDIEDGAMGTPSFIVKGLGNIESFMSCSHGAGGVMERMQATRNLTPEECDKSMDGIVPGGTVT